jgi:hypothetical protein
MDEFSGNVFRFHVKWLAAVHEIFPSTEATDKHLPLKVTIFVIEALDVAGSFEFSSHVILAQGLNLI